MLNLEELGDCLGDAYEHLFDIAYLRAHPISRLALPPGDARKDHAWHVHHALLNAIDELNPNGRAPALSREWRKHRLMRMRYVDGLTPQEVADALAISRRQYYRVHEEAIQSLTQILFAGQPKEPPVQAGGMANEQVESLRAEASRHAGAHEVTRLPEVIDSALAVLSEQLALRRIPVRVMLPDALPMVKASPKLLRQLLLGLIDALIERAENTRLTLSAQADDKSVLLALHLAQPAAETSQSSAQRRACEALANVIEVGLLPITVQGVLTGFSLKLVARSRQTAILVVDDNEDTLELYRRFLEPAGYVVKMARDYPTLLAGLDATQPAAICLDLMLPGYDGWDILQMLQSRHDARDIPVVICSVLNQRALALTLGAAGFIEKPFNSESLLATLTDVLVRAHHP